MKDTETVGEGERKMNFTGIDIGGTKCAVVTGNEAGICEKIKFETTTYGQTTERICDAVSALGTGEAIGISCGGPLDTRHGLILSPPNLPGWDNVPVTAMLEEKFGAVPDELDDFIAASQISQAEAKKFFIERIRIKKPYTSGVIWWNMQDGWPQMSDAVIDYFFEKNLHFTTLKSRRSRLR